MVSNLRRRRTEGAIPETTPGIAGIRVPGITVLRVVIVTAGTTVAAAGPGIVIERMIAGILLAQVVVTGLTVAVGTVMTAGATMTVETTIPETVADATTATGGAQVDTVEYLLAVGATTAGIATTEAGVATIEAGTATIHGTAIREIVGTIGALTAEIAATTIDVVMIDVVMIETAVIMTETAATTEIVGTKVIAIVAVITIRATKLLYRILTTTTVPQNTTTSSLTV